MSCSAEAEGSGQQSISDQLLRPFRISWLSIRHAVRLLTTSWSGRGILVAVIAVVYFLLSRRRGHSPAALHSVQAVEGGVSLLNAMANEFTGNAGTANLPALRLNLGPLALRSRLTSMRLRKNFTLQTSLMLKEGQTTYAGSFALASELKTLKQGPLSFLPVVGQLFSRDEFMLIKSAVLVFVTFHKERSQAAAAPVQTAL
eukprot:TRINITY_DN12974_c0_g1_i1.p1 TRINITY_DN12974_c0_g1~~TRINITY_DN12974_c0_g1_i1.p1  ORF type:complete len:201 (-),score=43.59 TRINITY_DN12974_c0_g1_i1:106-708(-)